MSKSRSAGKAEEKAPLIEPATHEGKDKHGLGVKAAELILERHKKVPEMKLKMDDGNRLSVEMRGYGEVETWAILMSAIGTTNYGFVDSILSQIVNATASKQKFVASDANFLLSIVVELEPRDQIETMLAIQMGITQLAITTFSRRLANVENIPQQDSASNALNKLMRTYTAQMEALRKYRTGGHQKVTVEHVTVNEGGQAIVGNVNHKGGASEKNVR